MSSLIKGRVYSNKDESIIVRLVSFCDDDIRAFVTDLRKRESFYVTLKDIRDYTEISIEHAFHVLGIAIPVLTKTQEHLCRQRYAIISSIIPSVEKELFRETRIKKLSSIYEVEEEEIYQLLNTYLAFGRIEFLVNIETDEECSMKPILKVRELNETFNEVGHAMLVKTKLVPLGNNQTSYLYLLVDTETHYVLAHQIGTEEDNYNDIKSLLHRCLNENNDYLPFKITCQIFNRSWNSYLRNIQLLNIETTYAHCSIEDDLEIKRLINSIRALIRGIVNIDVLKARVRSLVNAFNNDDRNGLSYKQAFLGLLECLPDNFIVASDNELEKAISNPYRVIINLSKYF